MIAQNERNGLKQIYEAGRTWTDPSLGQPQVRDPALPNVDLLKLVKDVVHDHPGTALLLALTLGGLAGWFIKRRN